MRTTMMRINQLLRGYAAFRRDPEIRKVLQHSWEATGAPASSVSALPHPLLILDRNCTSSVILFWDPTLSTNLRARTNRTSRHLCSQETVAQSSEWFVVWCVVSFCFRPSFGVFCQPYAARKIVASVFGPFELRGPVLFLFQVELIDSVCTLLQRSTRLWEIVESNRCSYFKSTQCRQQ